jgi:DNA-binding beta-propeller fold protein YncE
MIRSTLRALLLLWLVTPLFAQQSAPQYKVTGSIPIEGAGGWDYAYIDSANRTLYVTHGTELQLIDLATEKPTAKITGMNRLHGVATADDLNRGFTSDGGDNVVVIFDLKTNQILQRVKAGTNPDAIIYEPTTQRVFAFNGRSGDATAINAKDGSIAGSVDLGGKPEFAAVDGKGFIYDNLEDRSQIVKIDASTIKVVARWPLKPCEEPSGLAIDTAAHRLFSVCDNQKMAVVDYDSGNVVATVPIGEGPDAAAFDPDKKLAFSSNGEGTLTVVKQQGSDKYSVAQALTTEKSARTMAIDPKTHKIYLPAAQFGPPPAATSDNPHPRPSIVPGTFHLVVISPM